MGAGLNRSERAGASCADVLQAQDEVETLNRRAAVARTATHRFTAVRTISRACLHGSRPLAAIRRAALENRGVVKSRPRQSREPQSSIHTATPPTAEQPRGSVVARPS